MGDWYIGEVPPGVEAWSQVGRAHYPAVFYTFNKILSLLSFVKIVIRAFFPSRPGESY
jgi:hypothetical protein